MNQFFAGIFKKEEVKKENDSATSFSVLKYKNYDRKLFSYEQLADTGWWPDQILRFIEICKIMYIEFIQYFQNKASMFDAPLRNAIFFMSQKKYLKDYKEINNFIKHHLIAINDNYLISVIQEDNCYMDEYEDRTRSKNEEKHFSLLNAVIKLLTYPSIEYNGKAMKDQHRIILHIYVVIYKLKNMYAMLDDLLRHILHSFLIKECLHLYLPTIFEAYINNDIENQIMIHLRECNFKNKNYTKIQNEYKQIVHHVHKFKDILLYGLYQTLEFTSVFLPKDDGISKLEEEKYKKIYTAEVKERISSLYQTYSKNIRLQASRRQLIMEGYKFDYLLQTKETDQELLMSPRYSIDDVKLDRELSNIPEDKPIPRSVTSSMIPTVRKKTKSRTKSDTRY